MPAGSLPASELRGRPRVNVPAVVPPGRHCIDPPARVQEFRVTPQHFPRDRPAHTRTSRARRTEWAPDFPISVKSRLRRDDLPVVTIRPSTDIPLVRPEPGVSAELLNAKVQARNDRIVGDVVDASIDRAAELREQRAERDRERREAERAEAARQAEQREEFRRIEREDAEALAESKQAEAEAAERRDNDPWRATLLHERADRLEGSAQRLDTAG